MILSKYLYEYKINKGGVFIEKKYYIYKMFDEEEKLLYIGKTTYLYGRMNAHFSKDAISKQPWKLDVDKIEVMELNNQYDIDIVEIYLIGKEKPKYNIVSSIDNCEPTINVKFNEINKFILNSPVKNDVYEYYKLDHDTKRKICNNLQIWNKKYSNTDLQKDNTLSLTWLKNNSNYIDFIKNDISNFFKHKCNLRSHEICWTTYDNMKDLLKGKGYTKGFVNKNESLSVFNNCKAYAYLRNDYPSDIQRENKNNIDVNFYAIHYLVKVIKYITVDLDEELILFIPSKRILRILIDWLGKENINMFK